MKKIDYGSMETSNLAMGCMRIARSGVNEVRELIAAALNCGINLFDHADIYGKGQSETVFGQVLHETPGLRDQIYIQSKCGIHNGTYDFSYEHMMESVEGSLRRLQTDYLDVLLLHRPDALAEQEDFCRAVEALKSQGKVRAFGVSNMNPENIILVVMWFV